MNKIFKLFGNISTNLLNQRTMANKQSTWLSLLEKEEKEYFKKKIELYLNYVRNQLSNGRNINDLITEVQLQQQPHSDHLSTINDRLKQADFYVTKNLEFINHVANEVKSGRQLEEVLSESKKILQDNRNMTDAKLQ